MAGPGDESEATENIQDKLQSNGQTLHQSSHPIANGHNSDRFHKNATGQGLVQDIKATSTTTAPAPLGGSFELPSTSSSSSSLPPGLSSSTRGRGRGRSPRSLETATSADGIGWRSRPPPASNFRGGGRGRGGPSIRGGYFSNSGSPTSSTFLSARRGGRHGSYHTNTDPYAFQKQALLSNNSCVNIDDDSDEDVPPPGFSDSGEDCSPPGYNVTDSSEDDGPPPGFEEEDGPPPGFEDKLRGDLRERVRGVNGSGSSGMANGYNQFSRNSSSIESTFGGISRGGGRGGREGAIPRRIIRPAAERGGGVAVLEVPRLRPNSASSSYTSSVGYGHISHISQSPIPAPPPPAAAAIAAATTARGTGGELRPSAERFVPTLKAQTAQQPLFPEFTSPSSHFTTFSPSFVDEASSALRNIALGGVPTTTATTHGGGGLSTTTMVSTPEQPAPLVPPLLSTLQITPLYPNIGLKSIW